MGKEYGRDTFPMSLSHPLSTPGLSSGRIPGAGQTPWTGHSSFGEKTEAFWTGPPRTSPAPGAAGPVLHSPCTDPEFLVHQPIFRVLIKLLLGVHVDPVGQEISHYLGGESRGTGEGQAGTAAALPPRQLLPKGSLSHAQQQHLPLHPKNCPPQGQRPVLTCHTPTKCLPWNLCKNLVPRHSSGREWDEVTRAGCCLGIGKDNRATQAAQAKGNTAARLVTQR